MKNGNVNGIGNQLPPQPKPDPDQGYSLLNDIKNCQGTVPRFCEKAQVIELNCAQYSMICRQIDPLYYNCQF